MFVTQIICSFSAWNAWKMRQFICKTETWYLSSFENLNSKETMRKCNFETVENQLYARFQFEFPLRRRAGRQQSYMRMGIIIILGSQKPNHWRDREHPAVFLGQIQSKQISTTKTFLGGTRFIITRFYYRVIDEITFYSTETKLTIFADITHVSQVECSVQMDDRAQIGVTGTKSCISQCFS